MKSILKKLTIKVFLFFFGNINILKLTLRLNSLSYIISTLIAIKLNNGVHPKHQILKYKEWILSEVEGGEVVLDVGSNTGKLSYIIAAKVKNVYGIEINRKLHEEAIILSSRQNVEFINADATRYDYSKLEPIDTIILSNVLEHIKNREEFLKNLISQIAKQSKRIRILIRLPMIDRDWIVVFKQKMGVEWRLDRTHHTEYTVDQFMEEMRESKIEVKNYNVRWGELWAVCMVEDECINKKA